LRANSFRFDPLNASRTRSIPLRAIRFASLAAFRFVLEAFIGEEHLFAGGEDELSSALGTLQDPVIVFHTLLRGPGSRRTGRGATHGQRSDAFPHTLAALICPLAQGCVEKFQ
jgi:hypothetical protein